MISTRLGIFIILLFGIPVGIFMVYFDRKVTAEFNQNYEMGLILINKETHSRTITTGVGGRVLLGPLCPIEQIWKTEGCQIIPVKAILVIIDEENREVKRVETDDRGQFLTDLKPGKYIITDPGNYLSPSLKMETAIVYQGKITSLVIEASNSF